MTNFMAELPDEGIMDAFLFAFSGTVYLVPIVYIGRPQKRKSYPHCVDNQLVNVDNFQVSSKEMQEKWSTLGKNLAHP
ncbi:MAG: hypothetical protein GY927_09070 [bacterium]|nr:hypothetical protein [bacterium]